MHEQVQAQGAKARERGEKMEQQFEQLRKAVEEMRMGATERGPSGGVASPSAGSWSDPPRRGGTGQPGEQVVLLEFRGPRLRGEMEGAESLWRSAHALTAPPIEVPVPRFHL